MKKIRAFKEDKKRFKKYGRLQAHEPAFWTVMIYRYGQWCTAIEMSWIKYIALSFYWPTYAIITILTGINLPLTAKIGSGLRIWHFGCIVLHPQVVIGRNCDIRHEVTIGNRQRYDDVPTIGDNVNIGVGAKILGDIRVGNNVKIGANAVVLRDVPDNNLAVGNPARNIPYTKVKE